MTDQTRQNRASPGRWAWMWFTPIAVGVFCFASNDGDVHHYASYAHAYARGGLKGMYQSGDVEFPPLAMATVIAAAEVGHLLPDGTWLGRLKVYQVPEPFLRFKLAFRLIMALAFGIALVLLQVLIKQFFPDEPASRQRWRLGIFLGCGALLGHLLYDRLDLLQGTLMAGALLLLLSRVHYVWSLAVLALAIEFKVVPIVLLPLWLLGSLPVATVAGLHRTRGLYRFLGALTVRLAIWSALQFAFLVPFYVAGGPRCLAFVSYHKDRGIEFESTYAAVEGVRHLLGAEMETYRAYGSRDIHTSLSPLLGKLAPWIAGSLLVVASAFLLASLLRWTHWARQPARSALAVSQVYRQEWICFVLLFLLIFVATNKVFSPQYVLWLLPLVPLVPFSPRTYLGTFLGLCAVTRLIHPSLGRYVMDCTPMGTMLLVYRSLLLFALIAGLILFLVRRSRAEKESEASPSTSTPLDEEKLATILTS